jgi:hypothetical protein
MKKETKNLAKARKMMFEATAKEQGIEKAQQIFKDPKKTSLLNAMAKTIINNKPWEFNEE